MVHRSTDSRLLAHLITNEKQYTSNLQGLLVQSNASVTSLEAYAASFPPPFSSPPPSFALTVSTKATHFQDPFPNSQVILNLANTLRNADEAFRVYVGAVEEWVRLLGELKDLEVEVGGVLRDREILVTRLLKASKFTPKQSPFAVFPSYPPASSTSTSTLSLNNEDPSTSYVTSTSTSFFSTITSNSSSLPGKTTKKLHLAQAELQACEAHLARKEAELEHKRASAICGAFKLRFHALAECGWRWVNIGKEGQVVFGSRDGQMQGILTLIQGFLKCS
ncbi:hypothetical protein C8R41DRAFT_756307 [Lentinula lateritia]|uniref:DH domain-containing protein n=1 Tax=Lentinula lateritia TaxID=40482 RepID=A0ABQ8VT56_9AGAR|nr:hypothetical protein C8R41DRAFT_756307 [Lentinula lateritia]